MLHLFATSAYSTLGLQRFTKLQSSIMPSVLSKSGFNSEWQRFQATHPKLPKDLRDPQLDAMFWLAMGKHVVLCVGTGCGKTLPLLCNTALRSTWEISLLVAPLVAIENQCRQVCTTWGIPFLSLDETKAEDILTAATENRPLVVTTTITRVSQEEVQAALRQLPIATICVDEAQVINSDKKQGWTGFLPYGPDLWQWLSAAFPRAKYCLASATLTDASVKDMQASLNIKREDLKILFRESTRHNIFLQLRHHNIGPDEDQDSLFSFLPPIIADETQPTIQVFFRKKEHLNSASSFLKRTARTLDVATFKESTIRKLTGDSDREQKATVMKLYSEGEVKVLLSTDAGALGVDVSSTRLVVICGATSTTSGFQQEMGRAGRSGEPSVCIFLHRQGERLPKEMRPFFKGGRTVCLRKALTEIFTLSDHDVKYDVVEEKRGCSGDCLAAGRCTCTKCSCCSNCAALCQQCPLGVTPGANQAVKAILGLGGGEAFSRVEKAMKKAYRSVWRPVGAMAVPTFSKKLPMAMKRGRSRRPGTSSSSSATISRALKMAVQAEEEDCLSEDSDGNGSNTAIEDDGPILTLDDLLL